MKCCEYGPCGPSYKTTYYFCRKFNVINVFQLTDQELDIVDDVEVGDAAVHLDNVAESIVKRVREDAEEKQRLQVRVQG